MGPVFFFLLLAILTEITIQDSFGPSNQNAMYDDNDEQTEMRRSKMSITPSILMVIIVEVPTPFFKEQLKKLRALDYPKERIHVFFCSHVPYHNAHINSFANKTIQEYASIRKLITSIQIPWQKVADILNEHLQKKKCDYYFHVLSTVHLDNPLTLRVLLRENKRFVAPLLASAENARNGLLGIRTMNFPIKGNTGIIQREGDCILINIKFVIDDLESNGGKVYYSNATSFGHLVNTLNFNVSKPSPEMYEILDNPVDWEAKYIHPLYLLNFHPDNPPYEPCPLVAWFPLVNRVFCKHLIRMIDRYDSCVDQDKFQLLDIYLKSLYWDEQFAFFMKKYVSPLGNLYVEGFSLINSMSSAIYYVVKYNMSEQYSSVPPHIDNSEFSVTMELSQYGVDYDGGGCRYMAYNYTVFSRPGWILIHLGQAMHEGLRITRGVRYILVCFLNPENTG